MTLEWIAKHLTMGVAGYVANCLRAAQKRNKYAPVRVFIRESYWKDRLRDFLNQGAVPENLIQELPDIINQLGR